MNSYWVLKYITGILTLFLLNSEIYIKDNEVKYSIDAGIEVRENLKVKGLM